jgi:phosphoribosylformylglycinamidine synthase
VQGMGEACRKFNTPVTGGNVSFYNQNPDGPVYPTPTIGMVGLIENMAHRMTLHFKEAGDFIYLVGESKNDIACSEYLHQIIGHSHSPAPFFDLETEYNLQQILLRLIQEGIIQSAHDLSEGGLYVALCESGFPNGLGFDITTHNNFRKDAWLFGEAQSRVVVSVKREQSELFQKAIQGVAFEKIGEVTTGEILVDEKPWNNILNIKNLYDTAIEKHLQKEVASVDALSMF